MQKGFTQIAIIVGLILIAITVGGYLILSKSQAPKINDGVCIQVITPAKNQQTGECKDFPTPCDVPEGWLPIDYCSNENSGLNTVVADEDTANRKTYTNQEFGFSFKYPKDLKYLIENKNQSGMIVSLSPYEGIDAALQSLTVLVDDLHKSEKSEVPQVTPRSEVWPKQRNKGVIIVDGEEGEKLAVDSRDLYPRDSWLPGFNYGYSITIGHGEYIYKIESSTVDTDLLKENEKLFDEIVASFKFLK